MDTRSRVGFHTYRTGVEADAPHSRCPHVPVMTTHDTHTSDTPGPTTRSDALQERPNGEGLVVPKSLAESVLHESDHHLVPDEHHAAASDALLDALVDSFGTVEPTAPSDLVRASEEAAGVLRELRDREMTLYVTRMSR